MKRIQFEKHRTLKQVLNSVKDLEFNGLKFRLDNPKYNEVILV